MVFAALLPTFPLPFGNSHFAFDVGDVVGGEFDPLFRQCLGDLFVGSAGMSLEIITNGLGLC